MIRKTKSKKKPRPKRPSSIVRKAIIEKNPKCVFCGCDNILFLNVDHKEPLIRGGTNDAKNLQTTCILCNWLKGCLNNKEFKEYLKHLKGLKKMGRLHVNLGSFNVKLIPPMPEVNAGKDLKT